MKKGILWLSLATLLLIAAFYLWLGRGSGAKNEWANVPVPVKGPEPVAVQAAPSVPATNFSLLSQAGLLNGASAESATTHHSQTNNRFAYRLSNTKLSVGQLARKDNAILLENALLDTEKPLNLEIPQALRAEGDPGTYIVQSKGALDDMFRAELSRVGATIVSYIPNNAYLVRASAGVAQGLAVSPQVQTVLPYHPYFKVQSGLLNSILRDVPLPEDSTLNLAVFPDAKDETLSNLDKLGAQVVSEDRSPFGPVLKVRFNGARPFSGAATAADLTTLAQLSGVQAIELARPRVHANDMSRVRMGVAEDTLVSSNYLGLTGVGVIVNVNDTGVDTNHPDLQGRVFTAAGDNASGYDTDGHGTHIAGIIIGNGNSSTNPVDVGSFASGSVTNASFRGKAPGAKVFSISTSLLFGPNSDVYLQETAARTNAHISNNSWQYFNDTEYDLAAASYDAAVRDALPTVTGSQPIVYVFAAGNSGGGSDNGVGGAADTIGSPGTAKNVITVGAIEQARNITNKTTIIHLIDTGTNGVQPIWFTNEPWLAMTDSSNHVAAFSSRGNVGIGVEGDFGRFKPDVVAPGTFVVSTRSQQWDEKAYYNPTNYHFDFIEDQEVQTNSLEPFAIFVPENTVQLIIRVFAPVPLPIYVRYGGLPTTTTFDARGTNIVSLPPDATLSPRDTFWNYSIGNPTNYPVPFTIETELITTNDLGDYLTVLSNMNNTLGPYYRYESGTSMSAADISGMLALMTEYFEKLGLTNSPALMKALLISGSRPVADRYDLQVNNSINYEGWGLANLPTSIPTNLTGTSTSMLMFDQSPTNALATGQKRTYTIAVDPAAADSPLRVTLAWTDPPGNPVASTKLVNDLDLIITNRDTGEIFLGNDILAGSDFTSPWDTNNAPNFDVVNNVENIFLLPPLAGTYDITVIGKRVNVNAVTAHTNNVVQDYALVVSCGDGELPTALSLTNIVVRSANIPLITEVTNSVPDDPENFVGMLLNQHVGANSPLLGTGRVGVGNTDPIMGPVAGQITRGITNQWHFYMISNSTSFTNAAFLTFIPPTLADPRTGVNVADPSQATRQEADIELYVSRDPDLTNLVASAIAAADKSIGRGGTETIVYSNATTGVYYIGVKSEDQQAAEYGFLGVFSLEPFGTRDQDGNLLLRGFPVNVTVPDGTPEHPGGAHIFAVAPQEITIRRAVVTNILTHELVGDLFGRLSHGQDFVILNNHSGAGGVTNFPYIYNDSNQHDIPNGRHTDGPGTLRNFATKEGAGQWLLTMVDNAPVHVGTNNFLWIWLEKQKDLTAGARITIGAGECSEDFIYVPPEATNLTVFANILSGTGPVQMEVCPINATGSDCQSTIISGSGTNFVSIDKGSNPPLNAGWYVVRLCNEGTDDVTLYVLARLDLDINGVRPNRFRSVGATPILDDAVTYSTIFVTNASQIVSTEVGLRVDHPRVSDMVFHLISPSGTRVLLCENRGALTTNGMGTSTFTTNIVPVSSTGGPDATTNIIDTAQTSGTITIDYNFYDVPDRMTIYYQDALIFDSGFINGVGTTNINFGPGVSTLVTIVMNEGGNTNKTTVWDYTITSTTGNYLYLTFTENTNLTITPIKFAVPPFTGASGGGTPQLLGTGFETDASGNHLPPDLVDGWTITSNKVTIVNNAALAHTGNQSLALRNGHITRNLATLPGHSYRLTFAYRVVPTLEGIISWWPAEGNGTDIIGSHNASLANGAGYAPGLVAQAFNLDGVDDRVFVPDTSAHDFGPGGAFSIETWIRAYPNNTSFGITTIFDKRYAPDTGHCLGYEFNLSDGRVHTRLSNSILGGGNDWGPAGPNVQDGNFHHVALTLDRNSTSGGHFYVDGIPVLTFNPTSEAGDLSNDQPVRMGNHPTPGFNAFLRGMIDEPTLYSRVLTASEIQDIFSAGSAGKCGMLFPPAVCLNPGGQVMLSGAFANFFTGTTNWVTNSVNFTASQNTMPIEIEPLGGANSGMLLDDFTLTDLGGPLYVLPEESLNKLLGEDAYGTWKLEMWDTRAGATNPAPALLSWEISFIFGTALPQPIPLLHDIPVTNTINAGKMQFYRVDVPYWASFATNWLRSASAPVSVLFNQVTPPTGTNFNDIPLLQNVTSGIRTLQTNGVPPLLPGATYYLAITNPNPASVTVAIQVDFDVTPLTNGIPVTGIMPSNSVPRYFSYDVQTNEAAVAFQLTNLTANADLVVRRGLPFPTPASSEYGSFNPGTNDETIIVRTNSDPVPLRPGRYYLGVFNSSTTNAAYTIIVTDYTNTAPVVALSNAAPVFTSNFGLDPFGDYYRYTVSANAARVQFELYGLTGDMTLVARKGALPSLTDFDYISANPGTNDELITILNSSTPVPLTAGDWFLGAINVFGAPASYSIKATEFPITGINFLINTPVISANNFCLTWSSLPGAHYYIQAKANLSDTEWVTVSSTITASTDSTTWCLSLPSPYHFFRIHEGLAVSQLAAPFSVNEIKRSTNGTHLRWFGFATARFQVEWSSTLSPASWHSFTNIIAPTNGSFDFVDDGSQSGDFDTPRFYRLRQLP
jgi:subtilisin family serine protease/subtilisin-like proprotein convertase family protein